MSLRVEEIDARTAPDETLLRFYEVELACHEDTNPGEPPRTAAEVVAYHRHQPATHTSCHWVAEGGTAALFVHGPTAAFMQLLVDPARRRSGVGTGLVGAVIDRSQRLGVRALHGHHTTPAGEAFAARLGFVDGQRIVTSLLDLRTAELAEPRVPAGWRLLTWLEHVPEEHLEAYVRARSAMDDAPAPDDLDFPTWTAAEVRASEESLRSRDREMRLTVAIRDDGVIGAFTELRLSRGATSVLTDDTGTAAEHRRQGLARAVKLESLRRVRDGHHEAEVVTTSNAEENATMRHINESIGFRPTVTSVTSTLSL